MIPYDRIGVALLEDDGRTLRARWARAEYDDLRLGGGFAAPMAGSSLQRILETGEPRILNDLERYLEEHPGSYSTRLIVSEGIRASLTCPLQAEGRPIGFVFFSSRRAGAYVDAHVERYQRLAGQLALIVEKSRLYGELLELSELRSRYLGMAAHDLRGPLMVVGGFVDLALQDPSLGEAPRARALLDKARSGCDRMLHLVESLLDAHAIESGRLELERRTIEALPWLTSVVEEQRLIAGAKDIAIELDLEGGLPALHVDPHRLQQVLGNLIGNAIKFSEPGTTVTVRGGCADHVITLEVADQGPGIPEEEQHRLFTDFGRTSVRPTAGETSSGLGLAIVRRLVEAHGGHVDVHSQVGEGSVFRVTLPAEE